MKRFSAGVAESIGAIKYLYIRCGEHRFVPIWVVVTEGRVLVRSWNDKPGGWYRAFLEHPIGAIQVDGKEIRVRAIPVRSEKLSASAEAGYTRKYTTKPNEKYVKGFATPKRRETALELVPV